MEEFRPIPGYEGYYLVSESGRVWSVRSQRELKLEDVREFLEGSPWK